MINFEELDLETVLEDVRRESDPFYAKHELLHEMISEFYNKKDFDSETVRYLHRKLNELNVRMDILQKVRDYLKNMIEGVPFYVNRRVGIYMAHFKLTENQARLLVDVFKEHRKSMEVGDQRKYLLAAAHNVEWIEEEKCLHVQFEDTRWRYSVDGSWY